MNKLEHCPFCGASQTFFSFVLMLQFWKAGFYVECWKCGARGPAKVTKQRAADAWNYRHALLTPEQLADHKQAAECGKAFHPITVLAILRHIDAQQARIDALMLEFCPEEMTEEQRVEWARNQVPASRWPEDASDYGSRIAVIGQNGATGEHYPEKKP